MPENYADGYWTTAPASWVWNGNWKNTHTSTGTELPICDPTNAPTETPTSSPVQCTVKYTRHRGMIRQGNWVLTDDDLIPTDPVCVTNDDWTPPFCRDGKFPQGLAIGIDRCKVACAARPKCKAIGIGHPTRGTAAECFLAGEVNDQDNPLMAYGHWDFYDIEEVCEPECTNNCVSTPGWTIDSNPVTTCGWMEHICGPMRRGECLEHGGNVKCQWGYVTGNHWANYGPYGSPVSHCCNCKGFQMPENYADGYWTTAPASWVWNGNWKNTHTSTGTELPICDPTNAPTETPTSSPVVPIAGCTKGHLESIYVLQGKHERSFGSSSLHGYCSSANGGFCDSSMSGIHCFCNINDGVYGNSHSWIPGTSGAYAGFELGGLHQLKGFCVSRDNGGESHQYTDRHNDQITFEVSTSQTFDDPGSATWTTVGSITRSTHGQLCFEFAVEVPARAVRILPSSSGSCIDELEVYATTRGDVCTLGTMTAGGIGDRSAELDRKYFKFNDQTAYDDYASAGSQYWHNGLGRTTYVSQTSSWPEGCMNACCANPACQSFMFYKSECILYSVAKSAGMDDILGHVSRQGPWGISTGGPGYSIGFWEMSRKPRSALDTLPELKFYLKVEDYTSGNAWVDRVSNIEVHVPGSASFHEGYVHLSGTAITAPLQTNPNVMQSATYVI